MASVVNSVKEKMKGYYGNVKLKPFPQGTRLVVLIDDKTLEVPSFKEAQYVDLNAKHAGSVCVARYSNKTKRTRVMCRIWKEGNKLSFKTCTSKTPVQIAEFTNVDKMLEQVKKNLNIGEATFGKIGEDFIYVTGRITNYDGEMEHQAVLSILYIMAELANTRFNDEDIVDVVETKQATDKPAEDEFVLPEMKLNTISELKGMFK